MSVFLASVVAIIISVALSGLVAWLLDKRKEKESSQRKKREAKAEIAREILSLISMMIYEIVENFRFPLGKSEGEMKLLVERYNDLSQRLSEALHRANYILEPKDLESYVAVRSLIDKFILCKKAEGYNNTKSKNDPSYYPYPFEEYRSILYKNPTNDPFGKELSEARLQMEHAFKFLE